MDLPPIPRRRLPAVGLPTPSLMDEIDSPPSPSPATPTAVSPRKKKKAGLARLKAKQHRTQDTADDAESVISEASIAEYKSLPNEFTKMRFGEAEDLSPISASAFNDDDDEDDAIISSPSSRTSDGLENPSNPLPVVGRKKAKGGLVARLKEKQGASLTSLRSQEAADLHSISDDTPVDLGKASSDDDDDDIEVEQINSDTGKKNDFEKITMSHPVDPSSDDDDKRQMEEQYAGLLKTTDRLSTSRLQSTFPRPVASQEIPARVAKSDSSPELREGVRKSKRDWQVISSKIGVNGMGTGSEADLHRSVSVNSMMTMASSAIQRIKISTMRDKSFLVDHSRANMMGTYELDRHFPDRVADVFVCTWNLAEIKTMKSELKDLLLPTDLEFVPNILVICTQENALDRKRWEVTLQETVGLNHVLYHSAQHGSLHIAIFIKRELIWYCSIAEEDTCTVRAFKQIKTKGAVAVCFTLFGTSFLFLCSHFKANEGNEKARILDYLTINRSLRLPRTVVDNPLKQVSNEVVNRFDCVFWAGDLNFRITHDTQLVKRLLEAQANGEHPNYERLLDAEELTQAMSREEVFQGFQEGKITFPPSYKFDIGTDTYDSSAKARIPSYTDRILFKAKAKHNIVCEHYNSSSQLKDSDHKPVYGLYQVHLKPGRDTIPLSGGHFRRDIYQEAVKRRALRSLAASLKPLAKPASESSSSVCSLM